mmetsp:Transcript_25383/g.17932  ORF Transcript_25383/g.17932 Transcript_25383/m.17932 type:complete len:267 (+) Transcript_25383:558-1358(+)
MRIASKARYLVDQSKINHHFLETHLPHNPSHHLRVVFLETRIRDRIYLGSQVFIHRVFLLTPSPWSILQRSHPLQPRNQMTLLNRKLKLNHLRNQRRSPKLVVEVFLAVLQLLEVYLVVLKAIKPPIPTLQVYLANQLSKTLHQVLYLVSHLLVGVFLAVLQLPDHSSEIQIKEAYSAMLLPVRTLLLQDLDLKLKNHTLCKNLKTKKMTMMTMELVRVVTVPQLMLWKMNKQHLLLKRKMLSKVHLNAFSMLEKSISLKLQHQRI